MVSSFLSLCFVNPLILVTKVRSSAMIAGNPFLSILRYVWLSQPHPFPLLDCVTSKSVPHALHLIFAMIFILYGRYKIRTSDRLRVKQLRYRCANLPSGLGGTRTPDQQIRSLWLYPSELLTQGEGWNYTEFEPPLPVPSRVFYHSFGQVSRGDDLPYIYSVTRE